MCGGSLQKQRLHKCYNTVNHKDTKLLFPVHLNAPLSCVHTMSIKTTGYKSFFMESGDKKHQTTADTSYKSKLSRCRCQMCSACQIGLGVLP